MDKFLPEELKNYNFALHNESVARATDNNSNLNPFKTLDTFANDESITFMDQ